LLTAMKMLAESPLPATSPARKKESPVVEQEIVVEVAAGFARRNHRRADVDRRSVAMRSARGSDRRLDPSRGFELPPMRALRSRSSATARSSSFLCRVASASVETSSTPNTSNNPMAGVAASNRRRWA
jgi:hypothetical protein